MRELMDRARAETRRKGLKALLTYPDDNDTRDLVDAICDHIADPAEREKAWRRLRDAHDRIQELEHGDSGASMSYTSVYAGGTHIGAYTVTPAEEDPDALLEQAEEELEQALNAVSGLAAAELAVFARFARIAGLIAAHRGVARGPFLPAAQMVHLSNDPPTVATFQSVKGGVPAPRTEVA